jgi:endonuclease/exonuclease/phosphatase family metal-dependent hydrolase
MRVLNWNIHGAIGTIDAKRGSTIASSILELDVDVLLLQEVPHDVQFSGLSVLRSAGFDYQYRPIEFDARSPKGYSTMILSRMPGTPRETPVGWEKLGDFCVVQIDGVEFASCHIPNGSGNNRVDPETKQRHLAAAAAWLDGGPGRFLGGDFNEPWAFRDGRALSWADKGPRYNSWRDSVRLIFNGEDKQHLCGLLHEPTDFGSIRFHGRQPIPRRWYDHAFWSGPAAAYHAQYLHALNHVERLSDHSPLLVNLHRPSRSVSV